MYFLLNKEEISPSLGKIFNHILYFLFSSFRKYYGLRSYHLQKFQQLKIKDFGIRLLSQQFFGYLSTVSHKQLSKKPNEHIIFCKNLIGSSMCS